MNFGIVNFRKMRGWKVKKISSLRNIILLKKMWLKTSLKKNVLLKNRVQTNAKLIKFSIQHIEILNSGIRIPIYFSMKLHVLNEVRHGVGTKWNVDNVLARQLHRTSNHQGQDHDFFFDVEILVIDVIDFDHF